MKFISPSFVVLSLLAITPCLVGAVPAKRAKTSDIDILNFALTLEHLEATFYKEGLEKFSQDDFAKAGYDDWVRNRFEEIRDNEETHVKFISEALRKAGAKLVEPCDYDLPLDDVHSFVMGSRNFEDVGVSAYTGAAAYINDKAYLTVAAAILGVESRQTAWVNSAVLQRNPWNTPFETPLGMDQVFTIASEFIRSCPKSNPDLPVRAFPRLRIPKATPGERTKLIFDKDGKGKKREDKQLYAAFLSGLGTYFEPIDENKEVEVPEDLRGTVFVVVTDDKEKVDDDTTVAGPALAVFFYDSEGNVDDV